VKEIINGTFFHNDAPHMPDMGIAASFGKVILGDIVNGDVIGVWSLEPDEAQCFGEGLIEAAERARYGAAG
jgi:hypothetical protein